LKQRPDWLTTDTVLGTFGRNKGQARAAYRCFVQQGIGGESIWAGLNRQVFLGDDRFVERMQRRLGDEREDIQIPKVQRRKPPPTIEQIYLSSDNRDEAIIGAHATGAYSYSEIGAYFGLHFSSIGKIVRKTKRK